jgi:radical SAM-linked protein
MNDSRFRLRLNFQKRDRLRWLSHLELVRLLERIIRRAALPYVISQGFNAHMRHAPGPALPVGTAGLDEYFDVWLSEYLKPDEAMKRLQQATVPGLKLLSAGYVSPKAPSLQASHVHECYKLLLRCGLSATELTRRLQGLLDAQTLTVKRPHRSGGRDKPDKCYDLTAMVEGFEVLALALEAGLAVGLAALGADVTIGPDTLEADLAAGLAALESGLSADVAMQAGAAAIDPDRGEGGNTLLVSLGLKSTEHGSLRPAVLLAAAFGDDAEWRILSVARTQLSEDGC